MGGKLIQSAFDLPEKRLNATEFFPFVHKIIRDYHYLSNYNGRIELIQAVGNKETFGDADIVIENFGNFDAVEYLKKAYGVEPHCNGGVYTIPIDGFQVDFNVIDSSMFDVAMAYFNYSPMGNALGKLYHSFGLRYGHEGLKFTIREQHVGGESTENSHVMENVTLSVNNRFIHEFLGLDYDRFVKGFATEEEVYEYVGSSKYFNVNRFSFEEIIIEVESETKSALITTDSLNGARRTLIVYLIMKEKKIRPIIFLGFHKSFRF